MRPGWLDFHGSHDVRWCAMRCHAAPLMYASIRLAAELQVRFRVNRPARRAKRIHSIAAILLQIKLAICNLDPRPARLAANWNTYALRTT